MRTTPKAPISPVFISKKSKILLDLSAPDAEYADKSPKGSVDEGIRELIDQLNAYDGVVTTSSCAGRISVFLEGKNAHIGLSSHLATSSDEKNGSVATTTPPATGGKGGGEWLYTSHAPVYSIGGSQAGDNRVSGDGNIYGNDHGQHASLHSLFRLRPRRPNQARHLAGPSNGPAPRFVRFSFEPMILHVMAASLKHAQPVLSSAINAGFRESGVQSLRVLDEPEACPMVAIRTAGLALESIIGVSGDCECKKYSCDCANGQPVAVVDEGYLRMLVLLANERFAANSDRVERLKNSLSEAIAAEARREKKIEAWEDVGIRRQRKREEGLKRQGKETKELGKRFGDTVDQCDGDLVSLWSE